MLSLLFGGFAQINEEAIPDGIMFRKDRRQVVGTSASSSSDGTTTTPLPTSTPITTSTSTPTPAETTSSSTTTTPTPESTPSPTTASATPSPTAAATSSSTTSAPESSSTSSPTPTSSDLVNLDSTTINRSTLSTPTTITTPLVASETVASVTTSYWTSDGTVYSSVYTTSRVVATTTGSAVATISPILQNSGSSGDALSSSSQKIIGGVVGGVGGALVIDGLAFAVWRVWGRKRRAYGDDDLLESREDSIRREKRASGMMEEYQAQPVNTASNF